MTTEQNPEVTTDPVDEAPPDPAGGGAEPEAGPVARRPAGWGKRLLNEVWSSNPVTVTVLSFLFAMVIGGFLICVSDPDVLSTYGYFFAAPGDALSASWSAIADAYANLFKGAIVDPAAVQGWLNGENSISLVLAPISETLTYAAPLVFTGLAVAFAFRSGLFNIGAQGQAIMGAAISGVLGFALPLPPGLHLIAALIGGFLGGAIWGFVPGFLKARTGAHEVITTIMLNYVAAYFLNWLIVQNGVHDPSRPDAISKKVDGSAKLPPLLGDALRVNLGIILAVLAAAGVAWLLKRATFGFEVRVVGANPDAARTAGMSVGRTYAMALALAGGLAGLGGASVVLSTANALTPQVAGNIGFDGITVALLGRAKPWGSVLAGLLFGALRAGGNRMQSYSGIPIDLVDVLQALIVLFIAAPALIRTFSRLRATRSGRLEATTAKGW